MVQVPQISPLIRYRDVLKSSQWLCKTFGFTEQQISRDSDYNVMFISLLLGDQQVLVCPTTNPVFEKHMSQPDQNGGFNTQSCYISIDDLEEHCRLAREAGGKIIIEPTDDGEGGQFYTCRDPEGHLWNFGTRSFAPVQTQPEVDEDADDEIEEAQNTKEEAEDVESKEVEASTYEEGEDESLKKEGFDLAENADSNSDIDKVSEPEALARVGSSEASESEESEEPGQAAHIEVTDQGSEEIFASPYAEVAEPKQGKRRSLVYAALILFALSGWIFQLFGTDDSENLLSVRETQLAEQRKSLQQLEQQLVSNQEALKQSANLQTELKTRIKGLESVNADMVRQNADLTEDLKRVQNAGTIGTAELQSIQSELASTKTALETTMGKFQASTKKQQKFQRQIAELEAHLVKSSETIQSDQRRIATLEKQNEILKNKNSAKEGAELVAAKADLQASAQKLQVSLSKQNTFKVQIAELEKQLLTSRKSIQSEKSRLETLKAQNESLKKTLVSNSKSNENLRVQLAKLEKGQKKRRDTVQSERRSVQGRLKKIQKDLTNEREINTQLSRAIEIYKKESQDQETQNTQLTTELKQIRLNLSNTKSQHSATTKRYSELKKDYEALVKELQSSGKASKVEPEEDAGNKQKQASVLTGKSDGNEKWENNPEYIPRI